MGRRRRRKVVKVVKKRLPKYFTCPRCGAFAVNVKVSEAKDKATVKCGSCGLTSEISVTGLAQPVDIYCKFADLFYAGQIG
ncbi:MAG: hypothetical protein N3E48_00080 [Candidatus Bathyarchaeota archaeon]|nr:hypothetical protein [Candidatus Bathyarchaeota archaeon]